jgi:nitroimidazol reductase NimA-like FMN-containing flavoprotein (pyridoxamine 5'-phosphate oxidase superfamily)
MSRDGSHRALSRTECFTLLASVPVGRVVYTSRALPAVMPVNFVLDDEEVSIHTGSDATLAAAVHKAIVAFQADDIDPVTLAGWSVTITGHARLVVGHAEVTRLRSALRPWARVTGGQFVRIPAGRVSGSRFGAAGLD